MSVTARDLPRLLAPFLLLPACSGDPTASTPEKVYADGFETPLAAVTLEAEGGTVVRGYDAWLEIRPADTLVPRREDEYRTVDCDGPRAFFARVLGQDALDRSRLHCLEQTDPRFDFDNGRWLVQDFGNGRWYYRVWKHYRR